MGQWFSTYNELGLNKTDMSHYAGVKAILQLQAIKAYETNIHTEIITSLPKDDKQR